MTPVETTTDLALSAYGTARSTVSGNPLTGGEARQPLGLVVVGGLLFSLLVTLYLTPVFYVFTAGMGKWPAREEARASGIGTSFLDSDSLA